MNSHIPILFNQVYFFSFIAGFLLLGIVKISDSSYINEIFRSLTSQNYLFLMGREGKFKFRLTNLFLDLIFFISLTLSVNLIFLFQYNLLLWQLALFLILAIILQRILTAGGLRIYYDQNRKIILWSSISFNRAFGIIMLPLCFLVYYADIIPIGIKLWILIAAIFLMYLFHLVLYFQRLMNVMQYGIIYNFLYLCAIEIAPIIIVIKAFAQILTLKN